MGPRINRKTSSLRKLSDPFFLPMNSFLDSIFYTFSRDKIGKTTKFLIFQSYSTAQHFWAYACP